MDDMNHEYLRNKILSEAVVAFLAQIGKHLIFLVFQKFHHLAKFPNFELNGED